MYYKLIQNLQKLLTVDLYRKSIERLVSVGRRRKLYGINAVLASELVVIQLIKTKGLPILAYGLEVCLLNKAQMKSLNYVLESCFRKLFGTKSTEIVNICMQFLTAR